MNELKGTLTPVNQISGKLSSSSIKGDSAYQIALENGFVGTEEEWLLSLIGPAGEKGEKGDKGDSYTITEADYEAIAALAVTKLPTAEGGTY